MPCPDRAPRGTSIRDAMSALSLAACAFWSSMTTRTAPTAWRCFCMSGVMKSAWPTTSDGSGVSSHSPTGRGDPGPARGGDGWLHRGRTPAPAAGVQEHLARCHPARRNPKSGSALLDHGRQCHDVPDSRPHAGHRRTRGLLPVAGHGRPTSRCPREERFVAFES